MNHENMNPFERCEMPTGSFVEITGIASGSAAEEADIVPGDALLEINGEPVKLDWQVPLMISLAKVENFEIKINRYGKMITKTLTAHGVPGSFKIGIVFETHVNLPMDEITMENGEKRYRQSIPLEDELGNKIGEGEVLYEKNPEVMIRSKILEVNLKAKDRDGKAYDYDVLERFNTAKAGIWRDAGIELAGFCGTDKITGQPEIRLQRIINMKDFQTLLHEIGHTKQPSNPDLQGLFDLYSETTNLLVWLQKNAEKYQLHWWQLLSDPESINYVHSLIGAILALSEDLNDAYAEKYAKATSVSEKPEAWQEIIKDFKPVIIYPIQAIERDAEFHALQSMRIIRQETGIDMLRPIVKSCGLKIDDVRRGLEKGARYHNQLSQDQRIDNSRTTGFNQSTNIRYRFMSGLDNTNSSILTTTADGNVEVIPMARATIKKSLTLLGATPKNMRVKTDGEEGPGRMPKPGKRRAGKRLDEAA